MSRFTIRELKLAILREHEAVGPQQHVHKMSIIGLGIGGSEGHVARGLGIEFSEEERALAIRAYDELRIDDRIRPTFLNPLNPEDWCRITDSGRDALARGLLDALDHALAEIADHLVSLRDGASEALRSGRPDSARQAAHSARELVLQTLKEGAPGESTRRDRIRALQRARRGRVSESDLDVAHEACDLLIRTVDQLAKLSHQRGNVVQRKAKDVVQLAEMALRLVLLTDDAE